MKTSLVSSSSARRPPATAASALVATLTDEDVRTSCSACCVTGCSITISRARSTEDIDGRRRGDDYRCVEDVLASLPRRLTGVLLQRSALGAQLTAGWKPVVRPVVASGVERATAGRMPGVAAWFAVVALRHGVSFLRPASGGTVRGVRMGTSRPRGPDARRADVGEEARSGVTARP